ncbi:hypothetical protein HN51_050338, partial [Arachis hypogaea]
MPCIVCWNFIVKINNGKVRTTAHKYKLSFYTKTEVEVLPIETFAFNPFKFRPFAELEANALMDGNLLFDYIGEVVGKEEAMGMITCTGKESKRIALEKHKIKCTLFGELVDQVLPHLERDDGEPFIMVVQLFKSNVYLSSVNVQSTYYVSKCYFNPNLPKSFWTFYKLAEEVVPCSQRITPIQSQPQYSVADEINASIVPIRTIEGVLNMTQETSCWIVGNIVSLEVGKDDWSYTSRVGFKAMLRYRLQVIVTDGSGCMKLLLWNKEAEQMVQKVAEKIKELSISLIDGSLKYFASVLYKWEKGESYPKSLDTIVDKRFLFKLNITYKNINAVEVVYSVLNISDDEYLMSIFGFANSSFNASCSQHVPNTSTTETGDNSNGHEAISLSNDSAVESNCDSSYETTAKRSSPDIGDGSTAEAVVSVDVQASTNKTFKRNCGKKVGLKTFDVSYSVDTIVVKAFKPY